MYLARNWWCIRYKSLVVKTFRALLARLDIDTTNIVEGGSWSILKRWSLPFVANKSVRALIEVLSGLPLPGAAASRRKSLVAQRILIMEAVSAGDSKPHQRQKHKVMLARMKLLLAFARASSASGSRYIRLDPALSEESAIALGAYVVGHVCVRGWTHLSGAAPAS